MNHRERIKTIISGQKADRRGFWLGNPTPESLQNCLKYFKCDSEEQLRLHLNDDFRWICPHLSTEFTKVLMGWVYSKQAFPKAVTARQGHSQILQDVSE